MKAKISILIAVVTLAFMSCKGDDIMFNTDQMDLRPVSFAAPIAKVHIPLKASIDKYLDFDNDMLFLNSDNVLCYKFTDNINIPWSKDISIDGPPLPFEYTLPTTMGDWIPPGFVGDPYTIPPSTETYKVTLFTSEDINSYLSEAELSGGLLRLSFQAPVDEYSVEIEIPNLEKGNQIFHRSDLSNTNPVIEEDLTGYTIKANSDNEIEVICTFTFTVSSIPVAPNNRCFLQLDLDDVEFNYLAGYFGQFNIDNMNPDPIDFDFFDNLGDIGTNFGIQGIKIETKIINYAGLPLQISAGMNFTDENGYNPVSLFNAGEKFEVIAPRATTKDDPGITTKDINVIPIELGNSNYSKLAFDITGEVNYGNPASPGDNIQENFLSYDENHESLADIEMTFTVPFDFKLENYSRMDTTEFNYKDIVDNDKKLSESIKNFTVNFKIDNNMPFEVTLTAIAINDDESFAGVEIAKIDVSTGNHKTKPEKIIIGQDKLKVLWEKDVKNIVLITSAKTSNNGVPGYVKVKEDAYLDMDLSVEFESNIPISF